MYVPLPPAPRHLRSCSCALGRVLLLKHMCLSVWPHMDGLGWRIQVSRDEYDDVSDGEEYLENGERTTSKEGSIFRLLDHKLYLTLHPTTPAYQHPASAWPTSLNAERSALAHRLAHTYARACMHTHARTRTCAPTHKHAARPMHTRCSARTGTSYEYVLKLPRQMPS